ncbi:MAG: putative Ig domain-containing protein [Gammaproteobacteria bacterium]
MHYAYALRAPRLCALALLAVASISSTFALAAAPRISGTPATSVVVGQSYSFKPTASDADGNKLTFSVANKPGWASFSGTTGQLSGVPFAEHAGTWSNIVISVTDGTSKASLPAFSVVVKANPNKSPTITGAPPTTAKVGTAYAFTPTAKDPEGKALTFSIRSKPSWATFSTTTGKLSGTPTAAGTYSYVMIIASDGVSSASLPWFNITVSGSSSGGTNTAPTITGTPSTSATVGTAYAFTPTAKDANSNPLTFSISNKPSWATFSTSTGKLSGTPTAAGTSSGVVIGVSDGKATAALPPFAIVVSTKPSSGTGSASLSWTPPTRNTDGTTLTNLAGYRINYGTSAASLSKQIQVANAGISSYVVDSLAAGTWYFSIKAYTSTGTESSASSPVSKSVQ